MDALLESLLDFLLAGWQVFVELVRLLAPHMPLLIGLAIWVAVWTFAVDWQRLWPILARGGFIALILVGVVTILVWGTIAPPADGSHDILGLTVSNYVGKTIYVTGLACIMFLAGAVQLSGCCARLTPLEETPPPPARAGH